jgi:predicted dehydrogenase
MKQDGLKIVTIGGFGHVFSVLDEIWQYPRSVVAACAAGYENEDITAITAHPACMNARVFADYRKMIDMVRPDVAIVSTRLDRIAEIAVEAAQRGCHLICEKPLALTMDSFRCLSSAVLNANVNLTAMLSMKSKAAFRTARRLYQDNAIGRAVVLNVRKSYKWGQRPVCREADLRRYHRLGWYSCVQYHLLYNRPVVRIVFGGSVQPGSSRLSRLSGLCCSFRAA